MSKTIFLDAGHGGVTPSGKYTTAPSKMAEHHNEQMHYRSFFYEGVKNREYCDIIYKKLVDRGVNVVKVYHEYKDTTLGQRVREANSYNKNISKGFYFSANIVMLLTAKLEGTVCILVKVIRSQTIGQKS